MSDLSQGLILSLMGIGVTFTALALLILTIYILQWVFRPGDKHVKTEDFKEEEIAAAVGVAIKLLESIEEVGNPNLGVVLEQSRGSWWFCDGD